MKPLVSIIITSYNYGIFLRTAIDSALNQTYKNLEVIVIDDGSTDDSQAIIRSYGSQIVASCKIHQGQSSALNIGFEKSSGEIIHFLDSDDIFDLEKVEKIVDIFEKKSKIGWCFHPLKYVDNNNNVLAIYPPSPSDRIDLIDYRHEIVNLAKNCAWGPPTSGLSFRRYLLKKILPLPLAVTQSPDTCLRIVALALAKGYFLNEPLSTMRIHGNNARFNRRPIIRFSQAIWLRNKLTVCQKIANKIFALGLKEYWKSGIYNEKYQLLIQIYLSNISFPEFGKIILMAIYYLGRDFMFVCLRSGFRSHSNRKIYQFRQNY
ncbi:MAG: glycosyltransferase family 2 protein [Cyanosarcina radialis HA8281-LM2]|jgi:glycosyltransferase involved in cell wall biosynthesis|nr:glycosyltransferase family 2 protein [Cyanosarcina radialis HA8281-LM2]